MKERWLPVGVIAGEAMGQQAAVKRQAEKEIRRQGVSPEASPSTPKP